MGETIDAEFIKTVRKKYNMTQQAFAKVLGIGEASIIRYEQGKTPSKAMANLFRAANNPAFMADCLERDGHLIGEKQKEQVEKVIYALLTFDEKGEVMDINEMYEVTLAQEILNEQAALVLADLFRSIQKAESRDDKALALVLQDIANQVTEAKHRIVSSKTETLADVAEIRGYIEGLEHFFHRYEAKAA